MSVVGDNIRALRTLYGDGRDLTQIELAEIIGVTRETVNKWEAGSIGNVRTSNINRLREYFGLSVDDLRSETNGLAAQLRMMRQSEIQEQVSAQMADELYAVPLVKLDDLCRTADFTSPRIAVQKVEVPPSLVRNQRSLYAFEMMDGSMAKTLPEGSHIIVDLDAVPRTGSIVVANVPEISSSPLVRRLHRGATKAILSAEGYKDQEDIVLNLSSINVIGVVVWYQSSVELA